MGFCHIRNHLHGRRRVDLTEVRASGNQRALASVRRAFAAGAASHSDAVGELMLLDFVICPANLMHQGLDLAIERSPLPWLHICDGSGACGQEAGHQRLALLGTRARMEGPVYPPKLQAAGLEHRIPQKHERERINDFYLRRAGAWQLHAGSTVVVRARDRADARGSPILAGPVAWARISHSGIYWGLYS